MQIFHISNAQFSAANDAFEYYNDGPGHLPFRRKARKQTNPTVSADSTIFQCNIHPLLYHLTCLLSSVHYDPFII